MQNIVIYTCITDNFDKLTSCQPAKSDDVKFVAFVDGYPYERFGIWEIEGLKWKHPTSSCRTSRWHKLHPHVLFPEASHSIWIDGSLTFRDKIDPFNVLRDSGVLDGDFLISAFRHPERSCIYLEEFACEQLRKDDPETMRRQISRYFSAGYPRDFGLAETTCVCRRHCDEISEFNEAWWEEIIVGSLRDQLSFNYVAWKLKIKYGLILGCRVMSPYFEFRPHVWQTGVE